MTELQQQGSYRESAAKPGSIRSCAPPQKGFTRRSGLWTSPGRARGGNTGSAHTADTKLLQIPDEFVGCKTQLILLLNQDCDAVVCLKRGRKNPKTCRTEVRSNMTFELFQHRAALNLSAELIWMGKKQTADRLSLVRGSFYNRLNECSSNSRLSSGRVHVSHLKMQSSDSVTALIPSVYFRDRN